MLVALMALCGTAGGRAWQECLRCIHGWKVRVAVRRSSLFSKPRDDVVGSLVLHSAHEGVRILKNRAVTQDTCGSILVAFYQRLKTSLQSPLCTISKCCRV